MKNWKQRLTEALSGASRAYRKQLRKLGTDLSKGRMAVFQAKKVDRLYDAIPKHRKVSQDIRKERAHYRVRKTLDTAKKNNYGI